MNNESITFGELTQKLGQLGYAHRKSEANGDKAVVFEHKKIKGAMIILPEHKDDEVVDPFFLRKVDVILKTHGLLKEGAAGTVFAAHRTRRGWHPGAARRRG